MQNSKSWNAFAWHTISFEDWFVVVTLLPKLPEAVTVASTEESLRAAPIEKSALSNTLTH